MPEAKDPPVLKTPVIETEPQPDLSHVMAAAELIRAPQELQDKIAELATDRCARAGIHGFIHLNLDRGRINQLMAAYLIKELRKDSDRFDVEFQRDFHRRMELAEGTLDAHKCLDVCFGDLPKERVEQLKAEALQGIAEAEVEEAEGDYLFGKIISSTPVGELDLVQIGKTYPNHPFLIGMLAGEMRDRGFREKADQQIKTLYPIMEGYGADPKDVAAWLAGESDKNPYDEGEKKPGQK